MICYEFFNPNKKINSSLNFISVGYLDCAPDFSYGPGARPWFILHYVVKGGGYYEAYGKRMRVEAGDVFVIYPDCQVKYYTDSDDPWSFSWIGFDGTGADGFITYCGVNREKLVIAQKNDEIKNALSDCLEYVQTCGNHISQIKLDVYILRCFSGLEDAKKNKAESQSLRYVNSAKLYINFHLSEGVSVSDIVKYLGLERSYFYRIFKQHVGISPEKYLISKRIDKAKELIGRGYNLKYISDAVGICDVYYFSKLFKKQSGMTPSDYRKRVLGDQTGEKNG